MKKLILKEVDWNLVAQGLLLFIRDTCCKQCQQVKLWKSFILNENIICTYIYIYMYITIFLIVVFMMYDDIIYMK